MELINLITYLIGKVMKNTFLVKMIGCGKEKIHDYKVCQQNMQQRYFTGTVFFGPLGAPERRIK